MDWPKRSLSALLLIVGVLTVHAKPAFACTCWADSHREVLEQYGTGLDTSELIFVGSVVKSGESDVTGEVAARPPISGVALLFEVDAVYVGDVAQTLVVHAPGGPPYGGNCSIGVPEGKQFVVAWKNPDGFFVSGMCGIFPIENAPSTDEIAAALGPARPPNTQLQPEVLSRGVPTQLSPEDEADRAQSEFLNGPPPSFVASGNARTSSGFPLEAAAIVAALTGATGLLLLRRSRRDRHTRA